MTANVLFTALVQCQMCYAKDVEMSELTKDQKNIIADIECGPPKLTMTIEKDAASPSWAIKSI